MSILMCLLSYFSSRTPKNNSFFFCQNFENLLCVSHDKASVCIMNSIFVFYAMTWGKKIFYKALERKFERYYSYFSLKLTLGGICIHDIFLCMFICFLETLGLLLTTSCLFKRYHLFVVLGCPMVAYVAFHKS
jgi:hypothetical protein